MKIGQILNGFRITDARELAEHGGTLYVGEHIKSGAALIICDRPDANKTFSITFKTVPEDDTGVFHIIEHSVLCGSRKFPVKEPFVDLLKSSLKTFLNAFTFPDKTMYPVSSRNDKDFLNLIDVYMDAVLHPLALELPQIFEQEGWHYELHEGESRLSHKGVVLNEMKGAYSSVDDLEMEYITKLIYRGTPYAYDSGGDPEKIITLTYEDFCRSHAKFYHPSNSTVFLDGSVDLDKTLSLIDSYLCEYDRQAPTEDVPSPALVGEQVHYAEYEISEGESEEGKERVSLAFPTFNFLEKEKHSALAIALSALAGTNEAPLKKAILDTGICEDLQIVPYDGIKDSSVFFCFKNVKREDREKIPQLFKDTLGKILDGGIDRTHLLASINRSEFRMRELSGGGYPLGIALSIGVMDSALYGGDPYEGLNISRVVGYLRDLYEKKGGYEALVRATLLNPVYSATLYLSPSSTLGERRERALEKSLDEALAAMDDAQRADIIAKTESLELWQKTDDTPEAKATIPKLSIDDIPKEPEILPTVVYNIGENTVLHTDMPSRGITHFNMLFDASDLRADELFYLSILSELLENVDTDERSCAELQTYIKTHLGRFSTSVVTVGKPHEPRTYFQVSASALDTSKDKVSGIIRELLLHSRFTDTRAISKIIRQAHLDLKDAISQSGHTVALGRASAYVSSEGAACEYTDGLEFLKNLSALDKDFPSRAESLGQTLCRLVSRIFTRARMLISYVGARDDAYIEGLLSSIPSPEGDCVPTPTPIPPLGPLCEGIAIPAQVSFAAMAGMALKRGERLNGAYGAVRTLLSYGYLWNEIRVQGGAYGAGFVSRASGVVGFYTYRDPSCARSIQKFAGAQDYLRQLATSGESLDEYIIGAIGDIDPLYTPINAGVFAFTRYLRGESVETLRNSRRELLSVKPDTLLKIADELDAICKTGAVCVVGSREKLRECGDILKSTVDIT